MRALRGRVSRTLVASSVSAAVLIPAALAQQQAPPQSTPAAPSRPPLVDVEFAGGRFTLEGWEGLRHWAEARWRAESWSQLEKPGQHGRYDFEHVRVREGLAQKIGPAEFGFEWQAVSVFGVDEDASSGPGRNYVDANGNGSPQSLSFRQLYVELDVSGAIMRAGRQLYEDGTGLKYDDAPFQYVRDRGNARLLGNLDWTAAGRTFDGLSIQRDDERWALRAFGFEANEGAFEVDHAGDSLHDVEIGGFELLSRRGALVPGAELRAFAFLFRDDRSVTATRLGDELQAEVAGAQVAWRRQLGAGSADLFLWGAHETGDAGTRGLRAGAWIAEAGYRQDELPLKPWLRIGHARGQGDSNPNDGEVNDFYNGVPTNHTYYGYADLFALTNLRDSWVDLILDPHPQVRFVAGFHHFALNDGDGAATAGSGPFNERSSGYASTATTSRNLGTELDLTLRATTAGRRVYGLLGYSRFQGGTAYDRLFRESDVGFAYVEVGIKL